MHRMIGPLNESGSSNGSNSISFRWIANALVTLVFAVILSFLGWIKTTVDRIDSRLDTITSDAYGLQGKLEALKDQITALKEQESSEGEGSTRSDYPRRGRAKTHRSALILRHGRAFARPAQDDRRGAGEAE
jgi:hypothetical protein